MSRLTAFVAAALMGAATLTVVTQTAGPAGAETFPGPNGRIAYTSFGIWTMDPDGTDRVYLGGGSWPNWSPDGHQIAFAYVAPGEFVESLWVMNADGTNRHRVHGGGLTAVATNPSWSPDGTEIAFARSEYFFNGSFYDLRKPEIAVIKPDGSGLRTLTTNTAYDEWPEWSPDGSTVVYQTSINPGPGPSDINYDVYKVAADGLSAPVQLTSEPGWEERPSWSPDGTTIVYERAAIANTSSLLWLMDADGSNQRVLPQDDNFAMWMPSYSPDGSTILFSTHSGNAGSDWNIASLPAAGGDTTYLVTDTSTDWAPAQQADSTPPTITCDPAPTFIVGDAGAEVTATVADDAGGIGVSSTSLSAPAGTGSVGSFTVSFNASDQAGNAAEETSCAYEVEPPAITGQLAPPVDPLPALNQAKAGRVIPIKFRVVDELGAPVLGLTDAVVRTTNFACGLTAQPDAVEEYVANSGFREHEDGWYQWNWASPSSYAGTCRTLSVELQGTVVVSADFKFVR